MAKPIKSDKTDRKAKIDALNKKQRGTEKRQGLLIVVACVAVAVAIIGAAAYRPIISWWELRAYSDTALDSLGAPATVCEEPTTKKANGEQDHVADGTPVLYDDAPPAFGPHYNLPDSISRKFYTADDRPDLRVLVHNEEHGYTFVWYDETVADDDSAMTELRAVASKFSGDDNFRNKFKIVPWTSDDGEPFPGDAHIAMTHWSAGGEGNTDAEDQVGVWQYCSQFSGAALDTFTQDYPYFDSPEPNGM